MSREATILGNLHKANTLRARGFNSKMEMLVECPACGRNHKTEILDLVVNRRLSSDMVINQMRYRYPQCDFPSDRALDNFRRRHLPAEIGKAGMRVIDEIVQKTIGEFNLHAEGLRQYAELDARVRVLQRSEKELGHPLKATRDAIHDRFEMWKALVVFYEKFELNPSPQPRIVDNIAEQEEDNGLSDEKLARMVADIIRENPVKQPQAQNDGSLPA